LRIEEEHINDPSAELPGQAFYASVEEESHDSMKTMQKFLDFRCTKCKKPHMCIIFKEFFKNISKGKKYSNDQKRRLNEFGDQFEKKNLQLFSKKYKINIHDLLEDFNEFSKNTEIWDKSYYYLSLTQIKLIKEILIWTIEDAEDIKISSRLISNLPPNQIDTIRFDDSDDSEINSDGFDIHDTKDDIAQEADKSKAT